jgi:phosphohistidine phosphatase SixA
MSYRGYNIKEQCVFHIDIEYKCIVTLDNVLLSTLLRTRKTIDSLRSKVYHICGQIFVLMGCLHNEKIETEDSTLSEVW